MDRIRYNQIDRDFYRNEDRYHLITINMLFQSFSLHPQLSDYVRNLVLAASEPSLLAKSVIKVGFSISKLTSMTLLRARKLWLAELKTLLIETPKLEALECDFELDAVPGNGPTYLDCERLYESISPVKSTLKNLKLSICFVTDVALDVNNGGSYESGDAWGIKGSIGSLKDFEKLSQLEIPTPVLFGWSAATGVKLSHILPSNLGTLILGRDLDPFWEYRRTDDPLMAKLDEILQDRSEMSHPTDFTIIIKDFLFSRLSVFSREWRDIQAKYARHGVSISYRESELALRTAMSSR